MNLLVVSTNPCSSNSAQDRKILRNLIITSLFTHFIMTAPAETKLYKRRVLPIDLQDRDILTSLTVHHTLKNDLVALLQLREYRAAFGKARYLDSALAGIKMQESLNRDEDLATYHIMARMSSATRSRKTKRVVEMLLANEIGKENNMWANIKRAEPEDGWFRLDIGDDSVTEGGTEIVTGAPVEDEVLPATPHSPTTGLNRIAATRTVNRTADRAVAMKMDVSKIVKKSALVSSASASSTSASSAQLKKDLPTLVKKGRARVKSEGTTKKVEEKEKVEKDVELDGSDEENAEFSEAEF